MQWLQSEEFCKQVAVTACSTVTLVLVPTLELQILSSWCRCECCLRLSHPTSRNHIVGNVRLPSVHSALARIMLQIKSPNALLWPTRDQQLAIKNEAKAETAPDLTPACGAKSMAGKGPLLLQLLLTSATHSFCPLR